jgi:hypothetical protein
MQPLQAVARDIDRMTYLAERFGQVIARNFVIFNNQDVHGLLSYRRWTRVCRHDRLRKGRTGSHQTTKGRLIMPEPISQTNAPGSKSTRFGIWDP